eukprot:COSAG06_NODE_46144_length_349_cov_0.744000_2_plen_46_part_01
MSVATPEAFTWAMTLDSILPDGVPDDLAMMHSMLDFYFKACKTCEV